MIIKHNSRFMRRFYNIAALLNADRAWHLGWVSVLVTLAGLAGATIWVAVR
jgi:hypothetical protein